MKLEMIVAWVVATPLNIAGAPTDNPLVDTPLLKQYRASSNNARSQPQIILPASTIKGKLRGEAERLLRTFRVGGKLCQGRLPATMCPAVWWDKENAPPDDTCLLCRLFGSPWQPSPLSFSDVAPQKISSKDTIVRPGIGLSRVRGTTQEDLLFFVETTPALEEGLPFGNCNIEGEVADEQSAALLWMAVQQVAAFGSGRSRGRGWLKAKQIQLVAGEEQWDENRVAQVWRKWLGLEAEGGEHSG